MKKIEVPRTVYDTVYEAYDGTRFNDDCNCKEYEDSTAQVLFSRLKDCEINRGSELDLLDTGSEEWELRVFDINNNTDVQTLQQLCCLFNKNIEIYYGKYLVWLWFEHNKIEMFLIKEFNSWISNILTDKYTVTTERKELSSEKVDDVSTLKYD